MLSRVNKILVGFIADDENIQVFTDIIELFELTSLEHLAGRV